MGRKSGTIGHTDAVWRRVADTNPFSGCSAKANHSVLSVRSCNQYARSDSHVVHIIFRAKEGEVTVADDEIVHSFDEAGRLITDGEDRVFTLLQKVKTALDGLHIQSSMHEIGEAIESVFQAHNADTPPSPLPDVPIGTLGTHEVETVHYTDGTSATGTPPLPPMSPGEQRAAAVMSTAAQQEATNEANEAKVRQIEEDERARLRGDPQSTQDSGATKIGGGAIHY